MYWSTKQSFSFADVKYGSDYGLVYAIAQIAVCAAYGVAPLLGAQLADYFGFGSLMRLLGLLNLVQAALIHFSVKQNLLLSDDTPDKDRDDLGKIISKIVSQFWVTFDRQVSTVSSDCLPS